MHRHKWIHKPYQHSATGMRFTCLSCGETIEVRPDVTRFGIAMEQTLRVHDPVKGDSWKTCDIDFLVDKLCNEETMEELATAWNIEHDLAKTGREAVDVANLAMMIYHRAMEGAPLGDVHDFPRPGEG